MKFSKTFNKFLYKFNIYFYINTNKFNIFTAIQDIHTFKIFITITIILRDSKVMDFTSHINLTIAFTRYAN